MAQLVKNLPAMQETWVRSLGWEDPLEKGKAIHSSYSGLENSRVATSWTQLSDFHFHLWNWTQSPNGGLPGLTSLLEKPWPVEV